MSAEPLLILQLQRMGDLILTFPLLEQLKRLKPNQPVWVVAEPQFFQELMPLSPQAVFFPPSHCAHLARERYSLAINLSSRPEAARCLAQVDAPFKLGAAALKDGLSIYGYWQLYRAALTRNNRHNAFHWSDLFLLDCLPEANLNSVGYCRPQRKKEGRVGLVLGASEVAKHPDAYFWIRLARRLVQMQIKPVFLGGQAEMPLGEEVARKSGLPQANLCGRLSLSELAHVLQGLSLLVTPDTGPMHLADWLGTPVLNLSMGPVHSRETGPRSPGQWILRAAMSCVGCWQCTRNKPLCKAAFSPKSVAQTVVSLLDDPHKPALPRLNGLRFFKTGRDGLGLHCLEPYPPSDGLSSKVFLLEEFWQAAFLHMYDGSQEQLVLNRLCTLRESAPRLQQELGLGLARLAASLSGHIKRAVPLSENFWSQEKPLLRLFAGWLHMFLQNARYSPEGWEKALHCTGLLRSLFKVVK